MNLKTMRATLFGLLNQTERNELKQQLQGMKFMPPFDEVTHLLMFVMNTGRLSFEGYQQLRKTFVESEQNKFRHLFAMGQKQFGQIWVENHVRLLDERFVKSGTKDFDLRLPPVRLEVKAARAIDNKRKGNMLAKALNSTDDAPYFLNFQRLRLEKADAFIWVGVWLDNMKYWLLPAHAARSNKYLYHQQADEWQVALTPKNISEFDQYLIEPTKLADAVTEIPTLV